MRTLALERWRQARVWIGELPDAGYPAITNLTYEFEAEIGCSNGLTLAAVEVFVPAGGRFMYGLLGGDWKANASNKLTVNINLSGEDERLLAESLAAKSDQVRVGLPGEYTRGVLEGVVHAKRELTTLPSGELSIRCGAHGYVSSCNSVYMHLTAILIKLFCAKSADPSEEDLIKLFPSNFTQPRVAENVIFSAELN